MTPAPGRALAGLARPQVDCTSSYWAPIVDTTLSAYQLAGVAYVSTLDDARFRSYPIGRKSEMALGVGFAAAFAGSAVYGYLAAARCRRVRQGPPAGSYLPGVSMGHPWLSHAAIDFRARSK